MRIQNVYIWNMPKTIFQIGSPDFSSKSTLSAICNLRTYHRRFSSVLQSFGKKIQIKASASKYHNISKKKLSSRQVPSNKGWNRSWKGNGALCELKTRLEVKSKKKELEASVVALVGHIVSGGPGAAWIINYKRRLKAGLQPAPPKTHRGPTSPSSCPSTALSPSAFSRELLWD